MGIAVRFTSMNPDSATGFPEGSMTLLGAIQMNLFHPSSYVESSYRVPTLLGVACIWEAFCSKFFNSTILLSSAAFIISCDVTIAVIDPSKVSWTNVAICS